MEQKMNPIKKKFRDLTVYECIETNKIGMDFICQDGQVKQVIWKYKK